MFDRSDKLDGNQIINYRSDPAGKWLVLSGISPGAAAWPEVCRSPSYTPVVSGRSTSAGRSTSRRAEGGPGDHTQSDAPHTSCAPAPPDVSVPLRVITHSGACGGCDDNSQWCLCGVR
jgi:hypothetical protein